MERFIFLIASDCLLVELIYVNYKSRSSAKHQTSPSLISLNINRKDNSSTTILNWLNEICKSKKFKNLKIFK